MGALLNFFKRKPAPEPAPRAPEPAKSAPGTHIHFSAGLIEKLKGDHNRMLGICARISDGFRQGRYDEVRERLAALQDALHDHLMVENVKLYVYLTHLYASDLMSADLIRSFRTQMDGIGRSALGFIAKYRDIREGSPLTQTFAKDFEALGAILGSRITREEESLYPLYIPPA
jgi:hypothetical protein